MTPATCKMPPPFVIFLLLYIKKCVLYRVFLFILIYNNLSILVDKNSSIDYNIYEQLFIC